MVNVEANESIGSPKRKDPLPELQSPKGGFFAPFGEPKPLPLGEVAPKVTERASPAGKSRCAAIGRLFVRAILSLCQSCLSAALPSQSRRKLLAKAGLRLPASASLPLASCWPLPQQLLPVSATGGGRRRCPKGGAIGMSVSFRLDAESPTGRKRAGLAAKASGFWTTLLVKLSLAQTAEHYRFRDIVLCSSSGK